MRFLIFLNLIFLSSTFANDCQNLFEEVKEIHQAQMALTSSTDRRNLRQLVNDRMELLTQFKPDSQEIKSINKLIDDVFFTDKFMNLAKISKALALEYTNSCEELKNTDEYKQIECVLNNQQFGQFSEIDELSGDVFDAILEYQSYNGKMSAKDFEQTCRDITKSKIYINACTKIQDNDCAKTMGKKFARNNEGHCTKCLTKNDQFILNGQCIQCNKGEELFNGECVKKCKGATYHDPNNPNQCLVDSEKISRRDNIIKTFGYTAMGAIALGGTALIIHSLVNEYGVKIKAPKFPTIKWPNWKFGKKNEATNSSQASTSSTQTPVNPYPSTYTYYQPMYPSYGYGYSPYMNYNYSDYSNYYQNYYNSTDNSQFFPYAF